jgi:putative ABC transport system substrate-binding protein
MPKVLSRILLIVLTGAACSSGAGRAVVTALLASDAAPYREVLDGFKQTLTDHDVALLVYERQMATETAASLREHLAAKNPDLVLALGTRAAQLAREQVRDRPVVFGMVFAADSFSSSNATGVTLNIPAAARIARVRELLPGVQTIGLVYSGRSATAEADIAAACAKAGVKLVAARIDSTRQLAAALQGLAGRIQCFMMVPDPAIYVTESVEYLLRTSLDARYPVVGLSSLYAKAGALCAFDCSYTDLGRQTAVIALRILSGEQPSAIAPESPAKTDLSVNFSVADRLGIVLPPQTRQQVSKAFGW